jgi:ATP-dependent Clp protease adaptor protein ClpS
VGQSSTETVTREKIATPAMWKIVMHNDDFTPIDFVSLLLQQLFNKTPPEAIALTMLIHNAGKAQIGLFTKEIAITKVRIATDAATRHGHPLLTTAEPA